MRSLLLSIVTYSTLIFSTVLGQNTNTDNSKFKQLGTLLPTPNTYRSASGAPGHEYWQQRADYVIDVNLDNDKRAITGSETITYTNNSPDVLEYLWVQLDQNLFAPNSDAQLTETNSIGESVSSWSLGRIVKDNFQGGYTIKSVTDANGKGLKYTINKTMMRIDLPTPLRAKQKYKFKISWYNLINDQLKQGGRGGYEYFAEDDNVLYEIAQWFPRMAVYDDVWGWQHKQYLGRGEFALDFGDYEVNINTPSDFIVASTGVLQNPAEVLTSKQRERLKKAETAKAPYLIITQEEAVQNEKSRAKGRKTWRFKAENVRDFAWAASRKFIWDAMQVNIEGKKVWAMSYYPKEGNPLWGRYSTRAVAHTLNVYSKFSVPYPYPVAISVHGPVFGMEYPMISFNGGRPEKDGTYSERTKYALISVVIHEVGHNFFPMIVSSDERQWTWMDEGLNTFLQYLAEQEWDRNYPSSRGEPSSIVDYMKGDKAGLEPIMVNSESISQFGNNAYGKPAVGLNILRETILGRELFDFAFKTYSKRWAFKHPNPADFFRTMENASGTDLDWFWHGWFYTTDYTDIALKSVSAYTSSNGNPADDKAFEKKQKALVEKTISTRNNLKDIKTTVVETDTAANDFYNAYDPYAPTEADKKRFEAFEKSLTPEEKSILAGNYNYYQLNFENKGGLVMPIIIKMEFEDGSDSVARFPAEIWKMNNKEISKVLVTKKPVKQFILDPFQETADVDLSNNYFPARFVPNRFKLVKEQARTRSNPMREAKEQKQK